MSVIKFKRLRFFGMLSWWVMVIISEVVFIKVLLKLILLMMSNKGELLVRVNSM